MLKDGDVTCFFLALRDTNCVWFVSAQDRHVMPGHRRMGWEFMQWNGEHLRLENRYDLVNSFVDGDRNAARDIQPWRGCMLSRYLFDLGLVVLCSHCSSA
jgi:hypothetical protein